jgi:hypothetical protein
MKMLSAGSQFIAWKATPLNRLLQVFSDFTGSRGFPNGFPILSLGTRDRAKLQNEQQPSTIANNFR